MAQKRMFDRSIIETDKFLNISLSAKALYFLLGMEADDEGFVSPMRVMRLYGAELGDLKNLIDTRLVIPFNSGVVVITDWKQNNWLDERRIKPTQYQEERKQLALTDGKKYVLSNCLASIEESSIEENSVVNETCNDKIVAIRIKNTFFNSKEEREKIVNELVRDGMSLELLKAEIPKFVSYWTEKNQNGKKERWEAQKFFDVKRRIGTWMRNAKQYNKKVEEKIMNGDDMAKYARGF